MEAVIALVVLLFGKIFYDYNKKEKTKRQARERRSRLKVIVDQGAFEERHAVREKELEKLKGKYDEAVKDFRSSDDDDNDEPGSDEV